MRSVRSAPRRSKAWLAIAVAVGLAGTACSTTTGPIPATTSPSDQHCVAATGAVTSVDASSPVARWLAQTPFFVAHRGGDASWVEGTADAYQNAVKWNPDLALEVPVWRSADGVWVVSEEPTTGRVFNADDTISSTTWATLSTLRTKRGNFPMARLENDILEPYGSTRILFIDNKADLHVTEFFDLLDSYAGPSRYISKGFYASKNSALEARCRGYLTWGYYGTGDMSHFADTQARFDLLGLDYSAPSTDFATMSATGKPVIAYLIGNQAAEASAVGVGASGFMVSAVREVVPTQQQALAGATGSPEQTFETAATPTGGSR